jgi:hypothetical protein
MSIELKHPTQPRKYGRLSDYVLIDRIDGSSWVTKLYTNTDGNTYYSKADANTQTAICNHLDRFGSLDMVTPPNGYQRHKKWVRRDLIVQRSQTSTHGPMHKSEKSTCPLNICADRTGNCNCMCRQCRRSTEVCRCCKRCLKEERQCMCCEHCENLECVCRV